MTKAFCRLTGAALFLATAICAQAETQTLTVAIDESHVLQLASQPGAIVIGNPSIADVSIQGQKLFVHGRGFGHTNLIVLDMDGNQMASFNLVTALAQDSLVSVYKGGNRYSYTCNGTCQGSLQIGDDPAFFELVKKHTSDKSGLATGSASAEAKAPEAPQ